MAILYVAAEESDHQEHPKGGLSIATDPARYNPTYARTALEIAYPGPVLPSYAGPSLRRQFETPPFTTMQPNLWMHFRFWASAFGQGSISLVGVNTDAGRVIEVRLKNANADATGPASVEIWKAWYLNGVDRLSNGQRIAKSTAVTVPAGTLVTVDIDLRQGPSGRVRVFVNNQIASEYFGPVGVYDDAPSTTGFEYVTLENYDGGDGSGTTRCFSEFVLATTDTRGLTGVKTMQPTGAGYLNQWSGSWSDISAVAISDASKVRTGTSGQISSYAVADVPAGTMNGKIVALVPSVRVTQPQSAANFNLGLRTASNNYHTAAASAFYPLDDTMAEYGTVQKVYQTSPATNGFWTVTAANSVELTITADA